MLRFHIILFWTFCCAFVVAQQNTITGQLIDGKSGRAIPSASIRMLSSDGKIVAFKSTDATGFFSIPFNKDRAGYSLEVNHLGYKKYHIDLPKLAEHFVISLEEQAILLEDVEVKSKPMIRRLGDTLAYDVGQFAKEEDRSIGDVIKRLPGMEVSESGRIKYQGKEISNFYIDGDDLLDDRYALGTRTIPHKMVKDIQVLNNHEHLKVLKNKRFTDQVALNLVIKEDAKMKMTAEAKVGAGLPHQYESELNNILFNKKYKMLNVLNGNNSGIDLSNELIGYNRENTLARLGTMPINNLLSSGTVAAPPLARHHYFFNNSGAINTNNLFNVKRNWQIKSNIQALYNRSHQNFSGQTDFFTPKETVSFSETQRSELDEWLAAIRLSANKNVEQKFISNTLSLEYEKENEWVTIHSNQQHIGVKRSHLIRGLSNQLEIVPELKNGKIIQFSWFTNYGSKPQSLRLEPGIFPNLMNQSLPYDATIQNLDVPNFFTRISSGYRSPTGKISQYYGVNLSVESQELSSGIEIEQRGVVSLAQLDSSTNTMAWQRGQYLGNAEYGWKNNRLETALSLPFGFQQTSYSDPTYQLDERQYRWLFLPNFSLKYRAWSEDELNFNYNFSNNFGNIQDVYRGVIIRNYRSLSQNSAQINESNTHAFAFNYRLNRTFDLFFSNVGLKYSRQHREAMLSQLISNDISQTVLLPLPNVVNTWSAELGVDKYVMPLSGTLKLGTNWSYTDFKQLFNGELLPFQNFSYGLAPQINIKLWKRIDFAYQGSLQWSLSRQRDFAELGNSIFSATQHISIPFYPVKGAVVRISGRHLYTRQSVQSDFNYFFVDAFSRYRITKWKMDLELNLSNLANIKTFQTYSISSNRQSQNNYELRGRMAILKVIFAL
ncbi:carboxypeptidase-like regulatory domain-containing protein [Sphingobacterium deserti]|uniref:TonB-dependent receptor n=1 Tax=Sphingobacterium deserti TaxID=1229276 RepID=A0A0B8T4C9_9SPHI|nr:carboxypeptidase-like regulatory domain-containing protein [Sphingobacterium deserti]KGE14458.1 hypothetical protein DI53_1487 [Sphingobacterium deserti]